MRAELSVIIPTLDAGSALPACLAALFEGVEAGLVREVILSDGGSQDETRLIAEEAGALLVTGPPSRGGQLRRGVSAAGGAWLLVLHSDSVLPEGWSGAVRARMNAGGSAAFRLRFDAGGMAPRVVAGWANLRARVFGLPYGDQGLLVSRRDYEAAGGYPDIPLMEDVALARALKRPIALLPLAVTTSAARYRREGWLRRGGRNLWLLTRYFCGADPVSLAAQYRR